MEVDVFEVEVRESDLPCDGYLGQRVDCEVHEVVACSSDSRWILPNFVRRESGSEIARPRYSIAKTHEIAREVRHRGTIDTRYWDQEL